MVSKKKIYNLQTKTNGMTVSKYLGHLDNFAHIATYSREPRLFLRALKYYEQAEKCVPKKVRVINLITYSYLQKEKNTKKIEEKVFHPIHQRHFALLKENYRYALRTKKLSIALQVLKKIGDEIGLYNKANHTKTETIINTTPYQSEE